MAFDVLVRPREWLRSTFTCEGCRFLVDEVLSWLLEYLPSTDIDLSTALLDSPCTDDIVLGRKLANLGTGRGGF